MWPILGLFDSPCWSWPCYQGMGCSLIGMLYQAARRELVSHDSIFGVKTPVEALQKHLIWNSMSWALLQQGLKPLPQLINGLTLQLSEI